MENAVATPLDKRAIENIVLDAIRDANELRELDQKIEESVTAALFGGDGVLDSLGLVSLLMDIEEMLFDKGAEVSLSSEDAMSRSRSPYKDVPSLVDYIVESIDKAA